MISRPIVHPGQPPILEEDGPSLVSTAIILLGLVFTAALLDGESATVLARKAAIGVGVSLALSFATELKHGIYSIIRTDVVALVGAYAMTLLEFLFDQPQFDTLVTVGSVRGGIYAVFCGIAGLAIGRHLAPRPPQPLLLRLRKEVKPSVVLWLFWISFIIGMANMLIAVGFNLLEMLFYWGTPRFTQPWGRGRYGDLKALLYELSMLLYLVPPVAGVILARARRYSTWQKIPVGLAAFIVLFYGFASGTRNLFITYVVTFVAGYFFAQPVERQLGPWTKNLKPYIVGVAGIVLIAIAVKLMLAFRTVGFWQYFALNMQADPYLDSEYFLDYNLWVISHLADVFPKEHPFLGFEIPWQGLIRPIPRALWASKPEGLSISIEEVLGVEGLTLSASFIGEAFMAGGYLGVLFTGLFFGLAARWWSHCSSPWNSDLGVLAYASGFFAIAISMRSMMAFTTAILPTLAALTYCYFVTRGTGVALSTFPTMIVARRT